MKEITVMALMTLFHVLVFVVVHEIGVRLAPVFFDVAGSNLNWGTISSKHKQVTKIYFKRLAWNIFVVSAKVINI